MNVTTSVLEFRISKVILSDFIPVLKDPVSKLRNVVNRP